MKLSDGEKLILTMLSDIQIAQDIRTGVDPDFVKAAIYYDCAWGIAWEYPGIPLQDTSTPEKVDWVCNILQMWTMIEASFTKLSSADKQKVEKEARPFGTVPAFSGFDENSEAEELRIVKFLVNYLNRFTNFKNRIGGSQIPLSGRYRRMFSIYEPMIQGLSAGRLDAVQISKILCQTAPS